jgi:predicted kinase
MNPKQLRGKNSCSTTRGFKIGCIPHEKRILNNLFMWKLTDKKAWEDLEKQFDWVQVMRDVPQDARHHAEGNVAIHTAMVLKALAALPAFKAQTPALQEVLWASALLHDVEKRSTTCVEPDGSITAHGHARKGEMTTRQLLYCEIPTPFHLREMIAKIVRYHGLPLWTLEKPNPQKAILQASLDVQLSLVAMIAEADVKGRICNDQDELLYKIGLFREFAKENGCLETPKRFPSDLGKFLYFQKEDGFPDYEPYDTTNNQVVMLAGLPGTGKDHWVSKHYKDWKVVSLDAIRREHKISPADTQGTGKVVQIARALAKKYLRSHTPFVWNATNITRTLRLQLVELFSSYGAKVKIEYLEVPYAKLLLQNKNREYVVKQNIIHRMINKLEVPAQWEAHEVSYIVE